jgi:type II secretory pathway pseudopilin PulG
MPYNHNNLQAGQTLIETMVAALVLVMGIASAVSLGIFGLSVTSNITKQIVAIGLAREGIEAVKNMRDTNWLRTPMSTTCYDFYSTSNVANCYPQWLSGGVGAGYPLEGYDISPDSGLQYFELRYDFNSNRPWVLRDSPLIGNPKFGLDYSPKNLQFGLYADNMAPVSVSNTKSKIGRAITLSTVDGTFVPFNDSTIGPRLKVTVDVWWADKRCPVSDTIPTSSRCKVTLETYLTNWKNY